MEVLIVVTLAGAAVFVGIFRFINRNDKPGRFG